MQFPKWNQSENLSSSTSKKPLNPTLEQTLHNFQTHCSGFLHNLSKTLQNHHHHHHLNLPFLNPNSSNFKPHFQISLDNFINQAKQTFERSISGFSSSKRKPPVWARISFQNETLVEPVHRFDIALSNEDIADRLAGVPVYALTNSAEEIVMVSGARAKMTLGFFCFSKEDAKALLEELKSMNPEMRRGSKIVKVSLNKVIHLKNIEGVSFRFIPDSSQIMNAVKEKQKAGASDVGITGVPIFQSESLILRSENKTYRPFFFRKEDLEESLLRAAQQHQSQLNAAFGKGNIKISVLEDIITTMQESSTSKWDDVVFIPPGFDVSTVIPRKERRLTATG